MHTSLDKQVVSLKIAPKLNAALKKAGIEVEANFLWLDGDLIVKLSERQWYKISKSADDFRLVNWTHWEGRKIPTYTLPELLRVLPEHIEKPRIIYFRVLMRGCIRYHSFMHNHTLEHSNFYSKAQINLEKDNDATAAAKLFIWCVENGYIGGTK